MEYMRMVKRVWDTYRFYGGLRGSLWQIMRMDEFRIGTLVGMDKYGNKYYEDKRNFFGRHRWVDYTWKMNDKDTFWDKDGSMVPPEWHRWLHSIADEPPTTHPPEQRPFIWKEHKMNMSGFNRQYVPYSTVRPKIESWVPPSGATSR
ncbi:NADH dehydrogenase [ubiquinone] 1 alpha subcomplex subunit 12 [Lethenteron reissneri]|uniref:NADH dehydrogenase [ubiquinone] 1 alpha subcomplex subunit 12 n=1 Tax=Lethenteron reissneri TaxID=7753 RepID=UPI002AB6C9C9|nr:NADH dehydrogenase [ubiquinone] 1 alpha subcomplex subunit 12 [Lethenteron reissneri]